MIIKKTTPLGEVQTIGDLRRLINELPDTAILKINCGRLTADLIIATRYDGENSDTGKIWLGLKML